MTKECTWVQEDENSEVWYADCGHIFRFTEGTPEDSGFTFCCFCGEKLAQLEWEEPEDEGAEEDEE